MQAASGKDVLEVLKALPCDPLRPGAEVEHLHGDVTFVADLAERGRDGREVRIPESGPLKVRVVGEKLLVEMFRLAGVPGATPASPDAAAETIDACLDEPGVGVVLVGSSYASRMGTAFRRYLQRRRLPLVLRIPDRQDEAGCAEEIREHLQTTMGVRL